MSVLGFPLVEMPSPVALALAELGCSKKTYPGSYRVGLFVVINMSDAGPVNRARDSVNQRRAVRPQCGQKVNELRVYLLETIGWVSLFGSPGSLNESSRPTGQLERPTSGAGARASGSCSCRTITDPLIPEELLS